MIPTIAEIRNQILADIQTALNAPEPLPPRSVWGVLATAVAGAMSLLYRYGAWTRLQIFTETMEGEALERRGAEYGLTRTPATRWRGSFTFTGVGTVPVGTLIDVEGNIYRTREAVTVSSSGAISSESVEFGSGVDLNTGESGELVTPLAGIGRAVTVVSVVQRAEDAESDTAYRSRILFRQRNQPQGGAFADWILWATEVPGIAEANVTRPQAGFVAIFPLLDDPDPENRIPDSAKLAEVLTYVTSDRRSPIRAAEVDVLAATEIEFDVDIADLSPNNATLRDAIEQAVKTYLFTRRPKQYTDEPSPQDVISAAQITRIAIENGADVATVDLKNTGGTSLTSFTLEGGELAKLRTLAWT